MKHILLWITATWVMGCSSGRSNHGQYQLQGAWMLRQADFPIGCTAKYTETERTLLRLYDGDSVMYQCWMTKTESGLIIKPDEQCWVTLIDKGRGEHIYLEEDNPRPLTVADDSTIIIQQNGIRYTWRSAESIAQEWGAAIKDIMLRDGHNTPTGEQQSYVLSAKERRQGRVIYGFICLTISIIILLLLIARVAINNRKDKRRLQLQLQQIEEMQEQRPPLVRQAIESVEKSYFASDEYHHLQHRLATGQRLRENDWQSIESQIKKVYPGFSSQLRNLYAMSELEYQVCLLIKLRIAPSDMAHVLMRDASTISTVRSRLYKKVFGRKGGAKEWDDFILSFGV